MKEVAVEFVIRVGEEHPLAPVAALGRVMGKVWNDKPADPRHGPLQQVTMSRET